MNSKREIRLEINITVDEEMTDATDNEIAEWARRVLRGEISAVGDELAKMQHSIDSVRVAG